jgi:hypothetical protein
MLLANLHSYAVTGALYQDRLEAPQRNKDADPIFTDGGSWRNDARHSNPARQRASGSEGVAVRLRGSTARYLLTHLLHMLWDESERN